MWLSLFVSEKHKKWVFFFLNKVDLATKNIT